MASGYRTGGLHTGGVVNQGPDHMHGQTGALHGGGMGTGPQVTNTDHAPVAESRDLHNHSSHERSTSTSMNKGDKVGIVEKAVNAYARIITLLACLLALGAVLVYLGGLGSLQHRTDNTVAGAGYTETFQSSLQVPYAGAAHNQWAFQWYIGAVEVFVIMLVLFMLCLPQRILQRFKAAAMVLLGYALVLFTYETQSLLFLKRNGTATGLFSRKRILITLIGCIVVAIADGLMLLNLSLLKETNRDLLGPGGKRVAEEHQERNTDNYGEHEHRELHGGHHGPNAV